MWTLVASLLLLLPLLTSSQQQSSQASQSVQLFTSLSTGISLGPDRNPTTVVQTAVFTITPAPAPSGSGNATASGNATVSGNSTIASGNSTVSSNKTSSSTPSNFPTAPTNVDGGGGGPNGAPVPGQTAPGGVYGPDDGYISKAETLKRVAVAVSMMASILGGVLIWM